MKTERLNRKPGELNLPLIYFAVAAVLAAGAFVIFYLERVPYFPCVFKEITGVPCPTCGSTRLVGHFFRLDFTESLLSNPLLFLAGAAASVWFAYGFYMLFSGRKIKITFTRGERRFLLWSGVILFILNWVYLILAGK